MRKAPLLTKSCPAEILLPRFCFSQDLSPNSSSATSQAVRKEKTSRVEFYSLLFRQVLMSCDPRPFRRFRYQFCRYQCNKCHVHYTGDCSDTTSPDGERSTSRPCVDCELSASATVDNSAPAKRHAPSTTDSGEGGGPSTPSRRGGEPAAGGGSNRPKRGGGSAQETPEDTTSTPGWPTSPASKDNNLMVVCR